MPAAAQNIRFCHMYAAVYVCVTEEAEHTVARTMHTPKKKVPKVKERSRHSANNNPASTLWCHFMTCPHLGQQARSPSPMIVFVQGTISISLKTFQTLQRMMDVTPSRESKFHARLLFVQECGGGAIQNIAQRH